MKYRSTIRARLYAALAAASAFVGTTAHAMMAGAAPDSPVAHVDANTTTSSWSGVGSVIVSGASYSGVLVAPQYVLTAGHVVGTTAPSAIQFVLNYGGNQTHVLQAAAVERYPTASFPYDDLALIRLTTAAPAGVAVYPLHRDAVASGQRVTLVGYGASGNGDAGVSVASSRTVKRAGQNVIDQTPTAIDTSGHSSLFFIYDFDGPSGNGVTGGVTLGNAVETLVAGGDSGGPAFIVDASGPRLVGIDTFVTASGSGTIDYRFGSAGGGMLLSRAEFLAWIDATTGYTTIGASADVPTLPEWATIGGVVLLSFVALRSRVLARQPV